MTRLSWIASDRRRRRIVSALAVLVIFAAALGGAAYVSQSVFYGLPHVEDEHAFLFQAKVFASGRLYVPSPAYAEFFPTQFVLDYEGKRFGKYPPGYPAVLSLGVLVGLPWLVNPLLGALSLVVVFLIGRELYGAATGLLAAASGVASPFFLMQSGSFMSHSAGLFFLTLFVLFFLKATRPGEATAGLPYDAGGRRGGRLCPPGGEATAGLPHDAREGEATAKKTEGHTLLPSPHLLAALFPLLAGVSLGLAFLTRQLTALGIALPFVLYALLDLRHGKRSFMRYGLMTLAFAPFGVFLLYFNYTLTGDPFLNPYELWWPFDKIGFGDGEDLALTLGARWTATMANLNLLSDYLFGWPARLSLAFLALPFIFRTRKVWDWLLLGAAISLIAAYMAYWTSGEMYGPRYFYEALPMLLILTARGVMEAGQAVRWALGRFKVGGLGRQALYTALGAALAFLVCFGLGDYLPKQMAFFKGWYGVTSAPLDEVRKAGLSNALVFVSTGRSWTEFASVDVANSPYYDSDLVFAVDLDGKNALLIEMYPGRGYYRLVDNKIIPYAPLR